MLISEATPPPHKPLFELGHLYMTPGALEAFANTGESAMDFLIRHVTGDWGDLCPEDQTENRLSLNVGLRLFSAYHLNDNTKFYCITEWDRSATTFLLPSEY